MRRTLWIVLLLGALGGALYLTMRPDEPIEGELSLDDDEDPSLDLPRELTALLVGAVAAPEDAQVQIEQDLELARRTFGGPTLTLFGGGPRIAFVQERAELPSGAKIRYALAELFSAHSLAHDYRRPAHPLDGPATLASLDLAFMAAREAERPLPLLYVAGHGEGGESAPEASIALWGGDPFTPRDLARWLSDPREAGPVRVVITTCYSGAFAEIIFDEADESLGLARDVHCGLFATTAEDEASGCDPEPERARQEGFGIHFLHALRGLDRDGHALPRADLDGDGAVSLLEAHAHARVLGSSIDVPTLTSERFLRYAVSPEAASEMGVAPADDPVERYVVERLGEAFDLHTKRAAEAALEERLRLFEEQTLELADATSRTDEAFFRLRVKLLEIVPFADDPWHPRWEREIERHAEALLAVLEGSREAEALEVTLAIEETIERGLLRARAEIARLRRLVRAHENLELLGALEALGGDALARYRAIRRCEDFAPPLAEGAK